MLIFQGILANLSLLTDVSHWLTVATMNALALVEFVETPTFSRRLQKLLSDDEYAEFQLFLASNPEAGERIPGGQGLRKVRWAGSGRGKRGGIRMIYFWRVEAEEIYLLGAFAKNEKSDLSQAQIAMLASTIRGLR